MKLVTAPYRPSQNVNILPTIPENEVVNLNISNFRKLARENQALSMREPFLHNRLGRVNAHHDLASLGD